jgi:hypothetical protein
MAGKSLRLSAPMLACSAVLFISIALAQTSPLRDAPTSTPTFPVPEKIPANMVVQGWSQERWTELRQRYEECLNIPAETTRRMHLSPAQREGLTPIPGDWEACKHDSSWFALLLSASKSSSIPEKPPQWWTADGGTQGQWTAIRKNCSRIIAEMTRRGRLSAAQRSALPPSSFSHQDLMFCAHLSVSPPDSAQTSPAAAPGGIAPTPMHTPLPPALPVGPQSSEPATSDPPTIGNSFPGVGASACPGQARAAFERLKIPRSQSYASGYSSRSSTNSCPGYADCRRTDAADSVHRVSLEW